MLKKINTIGAILLLAGSFNGAGAFEGGGKEENLSKTQLQALKQGEKGDFLPYYRKNIYPLLNKEWRKRGPGFFSILFLLQESLKRNPDKTPLIVETGSIRNEEVENWAKDGNSTVIFDEFLEIYNGSLYSVDIDSKCTSMIGSKCRNVKAITGDSIEFLKSFEQAGEIDLLYLDSFDLDFGNPLPSSTHHLKEIEAIFSKLKPGTIIAVDDHFEYCGKNIGKGALVEEFLNSKNVPLIYDGYHKVWQISPKQEEILELKQILNQIPETEKISVFPIQWDSLDKKATFIGFSGLESWGRWTDANLSTTPSIYLKRPQDLKNEDLENHSLVIHIPMVYLPKEDSSITSKIFFNSEHVRDVQFTQTSKPKQIEIPLKLLKDQSKNLFHVQFEITGSSSPKDFGVSDTRSLGIGIESVSLSSQTTFSSRKFTSSDNFSDIFLSGYPLSFENFDAILKKNKVTKIVASITAPRSGTVFLNSILQNFDGFHDMVHGDSEKSFLHFGEPGTRKKVQSILTESNFNFERFLDRLIGKHVRNGIFTMISHHWLFIPFLEMFEPKCLRDSRWLILFQDRRNIVARDLSCLHLIKGQVAHNWSDQETHLGDISEEDFRLMETNEISKNKEHFSKIKEYFAGFQEASCVAFAYEDLVTDPFSIIKLILEEAGRSNVSVSEIEEAIQKSLKRNRSDNRNEQMAWLLSQKDKREALIKRLKEPLVDGL